MTPYPLAALLSVREREEAGARAELAEALTVEATRGEARVGAAALLITIACSVCAAPLLFFGGQALIAVEARQGSLQRLRAQQLCCLPCGLVFPVREGIPVMLLNEAVRIPAQEPEGRDR